VFEDSNISTCVYLMKFIPETRRVH